MSHDDTSKTKTIALIAADSEDAVDARARLSTLYETVEPESADIIVALGGDGLMRSEEHTSELQSL